MFFCSEILPAAWSFLRRLLIIMCLLPVYVPALNGSRLPSPSETVRLFRLCINYAVPSDCIPTKMPTQMTVIFHGVTESAGATPALRECRDVAKVLSIVLQALDDDANMGSKQVFRIGRPTPHCSLNPRPIKVIFGSFQAADSSRPSIYSKIAIFGFKRPKVNLFWTSKFDHCLRSFMLEGFGPGFL